jgi:xanthine dehydrogenase accessory factor
MPIDLSFLILLRGGGDLASGVANRLHRAGFRVVITELPQPLCVRRAVSFAEAVYASEITVEGVTARRVTGSAEALSTVERGEVAVLVDADGMALRELRPPIAVDARLAKQRLDTRITDAPLVIALGPGFVAGVDCHAVVETQRGHHLGRVYWEGSAEPDTGQPEPVRGFAGQRVLRAPRKGNFAAKLEIGDFVKAGEIVAMVDEQPILAPFDGVVRGLLHDGLRVTAGLKVGDIGPRGAREHCFTISDKARAVGGGVLEAILAGRHLWASPPLSSSSPAEGDRVETIEPTPLSLRERGRG